MRWFKVAAIAGGILIAFLIVGSVIGFVMHAVVDLVIAALVVGVIVVAIKMARSGRHVTRRRADREVRDPARGRTLPRADVEPVSAHTQAREAKLDVDEELARLKREMGG
ncbi:MAG: hypothetical protein JO132_08915 [Streptosporangiaceae bacterium]|nr:hypothetical protein [Streptosporangiaceae bacterium]